MIRDWKPLGVRLADTAMTAAEVITRNRMGIALVTDDEGRLLGTVVDGDLRRAVIRGISLQDPVSHVMADHPITARPNESPQAYLERLVQKKVRQLPVVDDGGRLQGIVMLEDLLSETQAPPRAVIMAGGLGVRLRPLTEHVPKPMLPVGDKPVMEHLVERLKEGGIRDVVVATHHKSEVIEKHFQDGRRFGLDMSYVRENERFGTIGALRKIARDHKEPILVINGDILTDVDFHEMRRFHEENAADLTVAVRKYDVIVPYGVVHVDGERVTELVEKPRLDLFINAGIYLISPGAVRLIPEDRPCDATELIQDLLKRGRKVTAFPVLEYWLDIGKPADYEQAQRDVQNGRFQGKNP